MSDTQSPLERQVSLAITNYITFGIKRLTGVFSYRPRRSFTGRFFYALKGGKGAHMSKKQTVEEEAAAKKEEAKNKKANDAASGGEQKKEEESELEKLKKELEEEREAKEREKEEKEKLAREKEIREWTDQVASEMKVPANVLRGGTLEEIKAHAEAIKTSIPIHSAVDEGSGGTPPPTLTKEQILAIEDEAQRKAAIKANLSLF